MPSHTMLLYTPADTSSPFFKSICVSDISINVQLRCVGLPICPTERTYLIIFVKKRVSQKCCPRASLKLPQIGVSLAHYRVNSLLGIELLRQAN